MNRYEEFVFEANDDLRILVRINTEDEQAPVQLFNDDDMTIMSTPPPGTDLRNRLLDAIGRWWLQHRFEPNRPKKLHIQ
jgi:hypothetical protein